VEGKVLFKDPEKYEDRVCYVVPSMQIQGITYFHIREFSILSTNGLFTPVPYKANVCNPLPPQYVTTYNIISIAHPLKVPGNVQISSIATVHKNKT
jgi:hypothetical protein